MEADKTQKLLKDKLKEKGLKVTHQRLLVLSVLEENSGSHMTAEDIYDLVSEDYPEIGLATVYRTLQLLWDMQLVDRINFGDGCVRYEIGHLLNGETKHNHHHLICKRCNKVMPFDDDLLESLEDHIEKATGFHVLDHELKFYGLCKDCMKKQNNGKLRIIPLGGLEQIGMNITAFEYEDSIVVVDCGLAFPEDDMLGIDLVIPDVTYLKDNISKVKGFVITHGHEDHIGALPYVLKEINIPIYTTKLTMGIIENKLKEHNLLRGTKRKVVRHGQSINLGKFRIEFIKTNHSIQDASALAIYSPAGVVVHTGDFKVDYTPVFGDAIDLQRFAEIGKKGVLALMSDSTNAERKGFTQSERTVGITFDHIFAEHQNTRLIIATFASNVDRVQQIINSAYKYGRKVVVEGRSMVNIISTASELGYLNVPENTLIEIDQMKNYPPEKMVLITTGSQGESMAALSRMAADVHRKVTIQPNDTIIFSSNPIPGNEKSVSRVINELSAKGAEVIFQDAHVSGHACQEELKLIYSLVKPKYAIPVHGEYRHLKANAGVAKSLGIPKENVFIMQSGEVLELCDDYAKVVDKVHTGAILVDGLGVGDVGNIVLRDRQHLAEDGIIIVVLTLERRTNRLLAGPDIVSRGFVYVRESEELMDDARKAVSEALEKCLKGRHTDWNKIKLVIRDAMNDYIWKKTKRRPMVIPIIMDVDV